MDGVNWERCALLVVVELGRDQRQALSLTPASSKLTPTSFSKPSAGAPIPHLTPLGHDNAWVTRQKGRSIWQRPAGVNWTPEGRERG